MSDPVIAAVIREADALEAAIRAGHPLPGAVQPPKQGDGGPKQPEAVQPPLQGQESDAAELAALEAKFKAAYAERQRDARFEAQRPANEALLAEALRRRGICPDRPDANTDDGDSNALRLDGTPWSEADHYIANEMRRLLPHLDLGGNRLPRGSRR